MGNSSLLTSKWKRGNQNRAGQTSGIGQIMIRRSNPRRLRPSESLGKWNKNINIVGIINKHKRDGLRRQLERYIETFDESIES